MAIMDVKTDITGTVWKIITEIGGDMAEDDPIMLVESMKMEVPISAPEAGKLIEVLVAEGDPVVEGAVVARIEM